MQTPVQAPLEYFGTFVLSYNLVYLCWGQLWHQCFIKGSNWHCFTKGISQQSIKEKIWHLCTEVWHHCFGISGSLTPLACMGERFGTIGLRRDGATAFKGTFDTTVLTEEQVWHHSYCISGSLAPVVFIREISGAFGLKRILHQCIKRKIWHHCNKGISLAPLLSYQREFGTSSFHKGKV